MSQAERPSPFTVPGPSYKFVGATEKRPQRTMNVGGLIRNLTTFADFYESASAEIEKAEPAMKLLRIGERDAQTDDYQREFWSAIAIDRVRNYVAGHYGEDLTIGTARRFLGDLIRECNLTMAAAEALPLQDAMDKLDAARPACAPATPPEPPRRGRKRKYDPDKDCEFRHAWEQAMQAGVSFKEFCKDRNIRPRMGAQILARERYRNRRGKEGS